MPSLTIVSGSPGAGKTTISKELARRAPRGVNIESDEYYHVIVDLIAPSTPEARAQNDAVLTAVARSAAAYCEGGYDVVIDGVIGPWYVPLFVRELGGAEVDYIVLRTNLEDALARVAVRNAPEMDDIVRKMHAPFVDLGPHERNVVETHGRKVDDILAEISRRQASGEFRLT
jgi:cytidylate kinase